MSDQELRDELVTLLVAGHETTATALSWRMERLTRTPGGWDALRAGGEEYAEAAAKEALRLRPVLPVVLRNLQHAGDDRRRSICRPEPSSRRRSTSSTAARTSIPIRPRSAPSASSAPTRRAGPTPGSRSAVACAAASARRSR